MERSVYTREEIKAFSDVHLKVLGVDKTSVDPDRVYAQYEQSIALLPPWHQVLLIETQAVSVVGDEKSIQYIYNKGASKQRVYGFFQPGDLSVEFNKGERLQGRNMIFWRVGANGDEGAHPRAHEDAHRNDLLIGQQDGQSRGYFSDKNPVLKQALAEELRHRERMRAQSMLPPLPAMEEGGRGILAWLNRCLTGPRNRKQAEDVPLTRPGEKLYEDYRELEDHLALYKDESSHGNEAFAEMGAHHTLLYARYKGDAAAVDAVLKIHYPHYWPAYRDIVIPEMERYAEKLLEKRQDKIDEYVMAAWALADAQGQEFDEASARREAGLAAASGTAFLAVRDMNKQRALYEQPMEPAMRAMRDLMEMNWYALTPYSEQRSKPYTFDFTEVQQQLEDYLDAVGIHTFVAYVKDLQREVKELARYSSAEERFANSIGLPDIEPGSERAKTVIDRFHRILNEKGLDGVQAYREALPVQKEVDSYIIMRTELQQTRDSLLNEDAMPATPPSLEDMERELRALAEFGGREAVRAARDEMQQETRVLSNYYSRLNMIAESIGFMTGEAPPYFSGAEILTQFDKLLEQGGISAVKAEIVRLTVPGSTLKDYALAREDSESARVSIEKEGGDISWGRKNGLYRPFSVAVTDMAKGFMAELAHDMRTLVMQGGAEALAQETARLRQETHMVVARAIGKIPAQGSGMS